MPAASAVSLVNTVPSALRELLDSDGLPDLVKTVNLAGEALPRRLAEAVLRVPGVRRLHNLYGPTEDTTYSTWERLVEEDAPPAIGRPIAGSRVHVLERIPHPAPRGAVAELYVSGTGLAVGYLNRPARTAVSFLPDPWSGRPGGRLYRTGDRVRQLADGRLVFVNRVDQQLKVRGFRIEPGEVEAALGEHPAVAEAVVVGQGDPGAAEPGHLVAYVVRRAPVLHCTEDRAPVVQLELRSFLRARLPEYCVPSLVVFLETLPRNARGKVDRNALPAPAPELAAPGSRAVYRPPRGATEELVADIWAQVLELDRVSPDDDFFELGGHSLLATRVSSRLRRTFEVDVALRQLFETPTPAALARWIETERAAGRRQIRPPLEPRRRAGERLPLSFAQQRLWFLSQLEPQSSAYNLPVALKLRGDLCPAVLEAALGEVVRRHQALRTVFPAPGGQAHQVVIDAGFWYLPTVDLAALPAERVAVVARRWLRREIRRPFDLATGPLLRGLLVRGGEDEHAFVLNMHHILVDGWSIGLLGQETAALYRALVEDLAAASPLPELPVQYGDFVSWQRSWLVGEELERQLSFWRRQLDGAPAALDLPTDRPRPAEQTYRGAESRRMLTAAATGALEALGRRHGVTLFMSLVAAFGALLARYSGQRDVVIGHADRQPRPAGGGGTDRVLRQHAGAQGRCGGRSELSPPGAPGAPPRPGRLRPPGSALRAVGRGARRRPLAAPPAGLPGDAGAPEHALPTVARPGARARALAGGGPELEVRPHPRHRTGTGAGAVAARPGIQHGPLRRRDHGEVPEAFGALAGGLERRRRRPAGPDRSPEHRSTSAMSRRVG